VIDKTAYLADGDAGLQIIDISDPQNPAITGSIDTPGEAKDVVVVGQTAYVADYDSGLQVIDVGNPKNPAILGAMHTPSYAEVVTVVNQTAYVADGDAGLQIIDVSSPQHLKIISSLDLPGYSRNLVVEDEIAYVTNGERLFIIDMSDLNNPTIMSETDIDISEDSVVVFGQVAYVYAGGRIRVIDTSNLYDPKILAAYTYGGYPETVVDQILYAVRQDTGVHASSVSNPKKPVYIGAVNTPGSAEGVAVVGQMAYVADGMGGLSIVPVPKEITPVILNSSQEIEVTLPGPSKTGHYNIKTFKTFNAFASYESFLGAVTFLSAADYQKQLKKKAVIAAGGSLDPSDRLTASTRTCANFAYLSLLTQGYARENIQLLAPYAGMDVDGDGNLNDVDDECTSATISHAVSEWALDANELMVYLVDHGGNGTFQANSGDILQAKDLDSWLDTAQSSITGKTVLIYDACYSGSFLPFMNPPAGKERIVITSSADDERAWFMNDGVLSFSYQFWAAVFGNATLYESYVTAGAMMGNDQSPVLDADGDGLQTQADVNLIRDFLIGRGRIISADQPYIGTVIDAQTLNGETSAEIWTEDIAAPNGIKKVWAVIVPPGYNSQSGTPVTDLDTIDLTNIGDNQRYTGTYDNFILQGQYTINIHCQDQKGYFSLPMVTTLTQNNGIQGAISVYSLYPNVGQTGKSLEITIYGSGFNENIEVLVGQIVGQVEVISPTELSVTLPSFSQTGDYTITIQNGNQTEEMTAALTFLKPEDYQALKTKKAIIASGGGKAASDPMTIPIKTCANYAYLSLLSQGYDKENILYLSPHADMDVNEDGLLNDVDDRCSSGTLSDAISEWSFNASELIIYLIGPGGNGVFYAGSNDIVDATDLDAGIDEAQKKIPGDVIVIYDAGYSGSFLPKMTSPTGKTRIVATSTMADEPAWFMNDGALSFSYQFWASVFVNANLYESFVTAKSMMAHDQICIIDANGDGKQTKQDVEMVRDFLIGRGRVAAANLPVIGKTCENQQLHDSYSATIWVSGITSLNNISRVWGVIMPPDYQSTSSGVTDLEEIELTDPDEDGKYAGSYNKFSNNGTYSITIHAQDDKGCTSLPTTVNVIQNDGNQAPIANAGPDQNVSSGALVILDGSGSSDADGTIVSYSWTQTDGTGITITLSNNAAVKPTFTAPDVENTVTLIFTLTITDNNGLTATDTLRITITKSESSTDSSGDGGGGGSCFVMSISK